MLKTNKEDVGTAVTFSLGKLYKQLADLGQREAADSVYYAYKDIKEAIEEETKECQSELTVFHNMLTGAGIGLGIAGIFAVIASTIKKA